MRIALQLALIVFSFPLLCSADEIITKDGKKVQGTIRKIAAKRVTISSGGVGMVYWMNNIDTIRIGDEDAECLLTYKVDSPPKEEEADLILPSPSYAPPDLEYTSAFVESVADGTGIVLDSGERLAYYGVKVPDDALARAVNRKMCGKKKVKVHVIEDGKAIVVCDGVLVNARLIEEGMALPDNEMREGELKSLFSALECHAEALQKGRWGLDSEKGKEILPEYVSREEMRESKILGYCVKGETLQLVDWKEIPPLPPGLSFGSLRGCTISIGSQAPKKHWTRGAKPKAAKAPAAAKPGGAPAAKPSSGSATKK